MRDGFDPAHAATHGDTREDGDDVSDNPEWTDADFARAKPLAEAMPELHQVGSDELRRRSGLTSAS